MNTTTSNYRVCSLDVWGNEVDGFEVNDIFPQGIITLPDDVDGKRTISFLVNAGWIDAEKAHMAECFWVAEGYAEVHEFDTKRPVYQLQLIQGESVDLLGSEESRDLLK